MWANLSGLLRTGDFISALNWVGWPTRDKASSIAFFPPLFFFFDWPPLSFENALEGAELAARASDVYIHARGLC